MPLFVRVDIDDSFDVDGEVTKVVLAIPISDPDSPESTRTISLSRSPAGEPLVYNGEPGADMESVNDPLAQRAVGIAEFRAAWPDRNDWEEDSDPRVEIGLYNTDDDDDDPEEVTY